MIGCGAAHDDPPGQEQEDTATSQQSLEPTAQDITVTAVPLWTDTAIVLSQGDIVTISDAAGSWSWGQSYFGPDGDYQPSLIWDEWIRNGRHGQLIGAVVPEGLDLNAMPRVIPQDDSRLFTIGSGTVTRTGVSGKLWLGFNDDYVSNYLSDNAGSVNAKVKVEPPAQDLLVAASSPPSLCDKVCIRAGQPRGETLTENNMKNLRAACYSCRCAQIIGHPVAMDKASETPTARTFVLTGTPPHEEMLAGDYPSKCVNPAMLDDVANSNACATGNRLGQAQWSVMVDGQSTRVFSKWIFRKKGAGAGKYNDWGKIYYREDGFTCNFDDVDSAGGRDGDSLGQPVAGSFRTHEFPALDLTWVVKYWQDRAGMTDAERVASIARDSDIDGWRAVFNVITGEQPRSCAGCHSAGPFIYTPFLSRLQYKGSDIAWQKVAFRSLERYVYPAADGKRLQIRSSSGAAKVFQRNALKAGFFPGFSEYFVLRARDITGSVVDPATGKPRTIKSTPNNQAAIRACMGCHLIGKGFNQDSLAINSTGTIMAPVDRPYQTEFLNLLRLPLAPAAYHWAMWMPTFGSEPANLNDWFDAYLESKLLLEYCSRGSSTRCNYTEWSTAGASLPAHF